MRKAKFCRFFRKINEKLFYMIKCKFENGNEALLRHVTVDSLIVKDVKLLLELRATGKLLEGGKYALPGGHLDRDEKTSQGIMREIKEETGYEVKNTKLFFINTNPNRKGEDRQNITFVYLVEVGEKTGESDDEVEALEWFDLSNLPGEEKIAFDHYEIIQRYLEYLKNKVNLPIVND